MSIETIPAHFTYTFPILSGSSSTSATIDKSSSSSTGLPSSTTPTPPPQSPDPLTYTHPLPLSILNPPPSTSASYSTYQSSLLDILTTINHLHHSTCLSALLPFLPTCSSPSCSNAITDLLKAPRPMLGLEEPLVVTACVGVCGQAACAGVVRGMMATPAAAKGKEGWDEEGWGLGEKWKGVEGCAYCGRKHEGGVKRCGGCGVVRYCGERCQRKGWRAGHRWECRGRAKQDGGEKERKEGKEESVKDGGRGGGMEVMKVVQADEGREGKEGKGAGEGKEGKGAILEEVGDPEDELWEE